MTLLEELMIKAELLVDGVWVCDSALKGVGTRFKEQVHHLFEYDFQLHQGLACPSEMVLPLGSVAQVRLNARSRYRITQEDGEPLLQKDGRAVTSVRWINRPRFYDQRTTTSKSMSAVAELVGEDCLSICHTNACMTFANGKQCAFCNLNYTPKQYDDVMVKKRAREVGQVVAAAFKEGVARHFLITGGILPGDREMRLLEAMLQAIRESTGMTDLPGAVIMTPPENLDELRRLRDLGLQGIGFNLECYNPDFFRAICPGKQELIGYDKYRQALRAAVDIFGAGGRVFSGFIAGIEPREFFLEGVQALAEEGVASIPLVWSPSSGTRFQGHRPPDAEWYMDVTQRAIALMLRHMKRDRGAGPVPALRCRRCQMQCLFHDVIESRRHTLQRAVAGLHHASA